MSFTSIAIDKNRITMVALLVIILGGISSYFSLPRSEDPEFVIRAAKVITYFPGASPERVEQLVTDKLEKRIQEIPEIDFIASESSTGVSDITVNIKESYDDMRPIWDDMRRRVDATLSELPDGVVGPFVNDEFGEVFGINIALTGDGYSYAELKDIADDIRDEILRLDEVAKVDIYGAQDERVFVEFNDARLADFGLSAVQLQKILESRNIIIPGGHITTEDEKISLEPSGNYESVDDLRRTIINVPGRKELVYLEDLTTVRRAYIEPPEKIVHSSGQPSLLMAISNREGGNVIKLGEQVSELLDRLHLSYPIGLEFEIITYQPDIVDNKIKEFSMSLLQAIAIVIAVMLLFLGIRTGLIVASLIPTAIIMAFLIMAFLDIGLDRMSLASLIIALGMLVDNAVVMSESIMTQMQAGKKVYNAAIDSAAELKIPLLTSSLTTAAAFLVTFLAQSNVGEYTAPLFKVVTITLMSSWILTLTLIPLLCVLFMKVKMNKEKESFNSRFYHMYRNFLLAILKNRALTIGIVIIVFIIAMSGMQFIPVRFFPPSDRPLIIAELEFPVGSNIDRTKKMINSLEQFLNDSLKISSQDSSGIINWASFIGHSAPKFALSYNPKKKTPEYAIMLINGSDRVSAEAAVLRLEEFSLNNFPDLKASFNPLDLGPPVTNPVAVRISGKDINELFTIVEKVKAKLATIKGSKNIDDNWGKQSKKLMVMINQTRARRASVTSQDIALSLQTNLAGLVTTEYREDDKVIPVVMRSFSADRQDIGKLESMNVYSQLTGQSVPLKQVADVEVVWQSAEIIRRDRMKTVTISSDVTNEVTFADVNAQLEPWLNQESTNWPIGYNWELGGEKESSQKANASIVAQLPTVALIIVILLVGQFNSIRRPAIILLTIPLGLIGVVFGLLVAKSYLGFMTFLGIISLSGIVINNAIVLLDRFRIEIEENGMVPQRAIIESCQKRLRPILLTTFTTVGGLIPLWTGGDPMFPPMAIAIIFGLIFATLLTLGIVPVFYSLFFRIKFKDFSF